MNPIVELLAKLRKLDINLELNNGKLKISAPKGALNEALKESLKEHKEGIVDFLTEVDKRSKQTISLIPKVDPALKLSQIPATDSQARFWFLDKFSPADASFNIPAAVEIRGELNIDVLEKSIQHLIERHDSLRTSFTERDGQPFLQIPDHIDWKLEVVNIGEEASSSEQLDAIIANETKTVLAKGFDLSVAPLLRIRLLAFKKNFDPEDQRKRYILLNCIHHIVCDGWSVGIILREMTQIYLSLLQGQNNPLPSLDINFADYAYWQNQDEQRQVNEELLAYWQHELKGAQGLLDFPYDRPRPIKPAVAGATFNFSFDEALSHRVDIFCQKQGLTPFMFFMGMYQIALAKYTKHDDICAGIPIAGRTQEEIEKVIGLFLNALIIRSKPSPGKSLKSYFEALKATTLNAFDKQNLALDTLIDTLDIDRETDEVPGVQFGFILQNAETSIRDGSQSKSDMPSYESDLLSLRPVQYQTDTSKHDMCLSVGEIEKCYFASIEYKTSLLDQKTIEEFSQRFQGLVLQVLDTPLERPIADLSIISKAALCEELELSESNIESIHALTESQKGFYFNDLVRGENQSTLIGTSIRIQGEFDLVSWQASLQSLCDQRAALRVQLIAGTKALHEPVYQVVLKSQLIDYEIEPAPEGQNFWEASIAQERAKQIIYTPFNLHGSSLVRYRVLALAEHEYLLVTSMHHILMDAVSALQHWSEAQRIYQQQEIKQDNYLEYLAFASNTIDSPQVMAHWQSALKDIDSPDYSVQGRLNKNTDKPKSTHEHGERCLKRHMVEGEEWQAVKHYCRQQGITPAILYKTIFAFMVKTYSQPDGGFYLNEIITGRPKDYLQTLGNCFLIQPFIFQDDFFAGEISKAYTLAKAQQKANRSNAFISQQSINKLIPPGRVSFYYNYLTFIPPENFLGNPVDFRDWGNEIDDAVEFNPRLGPDGLELNLFYREDLFREQGLLETIQNIISQLISGTESVRQLNYVNDVSHGACLHAPAIESQTKQRTVVDLFLKQARLRADKLAVRSEAKSWTFQQLDKASACVASYLQENGLGCGDLIVVEQEKTPEAIASILGVLRLGAQYLPLDDSLPDDRKAFIVEDSCAALVLNTELIQKILPTPKDGLEDTSFDGVCFNDKAITGQSAAYTIYTSGSTGLPKGVRVQHGALARTFFAWEASFKLGPSDHHLQMASLGFDVFTGDWVRALCSGAALSLVDKETLLDPEKLDRIISEQEITIAEFVPAVLRGISQLHSERRSAGKNDAPIKMRMLIVGSDAWFESDQMLLAQCVHEQCVLVNSYGVTEAVIDSSFSCVKAGSYLRAPVDKKASVSIGEPFANTTLYVLDDQQRLLPKEVAGELYIAGDDLAEAYVSNGQIDQQKTQASFLNNTLWYGAGRMYRTGDRAKLSQSGELLLLGRIGQQVKIRGFRVELGEVENQIAALPSVEECVVLAHDFSEGQRALVAYVVFETSHSLSTSELRLALGKNLPDYMLPQLCITLPSIPLNANGKLDRKALPEPDFSQSLQEAFVAPRNAIEQALIEIWQAVLGIDKIGVNDNFFELGGHSLLATQLVSRVKMRFDRELAIKSVFELPTAAELSQALNILLSKDAALSAPDIVKVDRSELMPVSYAQQRFWFLDRLVPGFFAYNMPFGLRLKGDFDTDVFERVLSEILARHEILRSHFVAVDDQVMAQVEAPAIFPLQHHVIKERNPEKQQALIQGLVQENAHKPFNLADDLLIRCSVVEVVASTQGLEQEHLILGCMHHIVSDGWSVRILFAEIALLYNAFVQGRPSPLPDLSLQYLDYAHWEQNWLQGEVLERYTDFWVNELEGAPEILRLPTDKERPSVQTFSGKQISVSKPLIFRQQLERFSKNQGVSLFMTMMAGMSILMSRYSREKEILIGTPVAGRDNLATEGIIGLFLNAVIIRHRLSHNPSVSELLSQVKDSALGAFAHQDMPAEILYERVANHRNPQYPAGAQVGLVLQNTANRQTELSAKQFGDQLLNMSAELLGTEQVISNYDFGFTVIEQDEGLQIIAEFNTDLFFDSTIETMLNQYVLILESMMSNPEVAVENISLVNQADLLSTIKNDLGSEYSQFSSALPLTAMQEGMLLANKLNPFSKEYSVGFSVRIRQALDVELWTSSLQGLIDTQELARIAFRESSVPYLDSAYQLVKKQKSAQVEWVDWSQSERMPSEDDIETFASQFINAPYNVLKDDLMRVMLIKIADDHFVGVFGAHHILMDGISVVAFGVMGAMNYEIAHNGGQPIVHEDKYKEYLLANQVAMDTSNVRAFWKDTLIDRYKELEPEQTSKSLEALDYPVEPSLLYDLQNPPQKTKKSLTLDPAHWESVKVFCKQQRITPALYFKGLYALVLNRYCRTENDFYIFEILAGRPAGHMNALGCYFQQIPIVLASENFGPNATILDLFKNLRQQQKKTKRNQLISVPAQLSMLPEAPVSFMYNFEHYIPDFFFLGQPVEIQEYSNQVNGIVQFLVKSLANSVQLNIQSHKGFFNDFDLLERINDYSQQIVSGNLILHDLKLLNTEEKNQQLELWNQKPITQLSAQTIHSLIEKSALAFPQHVASRDLSGEYSYSELNEKANQLARYMESLGITKGDVVGVCLPLCKEVPLAILAILKTGAAYMPMDSRYPDERLKYFIEDSKPKLILSVPHLIARVATKQEEQALFYSVFEEEHQQLSTVNLDLDLSADELIYVLYTSGSTGKPNCTASYHRCEYNLISWYCDHFSMNEDDKVLIISALGFDLTQKNLMAPLTCGATIVFHDSEIYDDGAIRPLLKNEAITWLNCAPSAFYPLVENETEDKELSSLRWVFLGGEAIAFDRLERWYRENDCLLVNSYGPSECTDISSFYILEKDAIDSLQGTSIPIGKANDNILLYVLNQHQELLPVGLPGELYVGGLGVGAGYLNNATLNAQRFFENPFGEGQIYKTGDLVKYREDGNIEYIGRTDFQIKVRGVRIEPGEIESRIAAMDGIQECVVILDGSDRLVAYVASERFTKTPTVLIERIESELRRTLSAGMQPSHYVVLGKLPLSPNGKVDRSALPEPTLFQREFVSPETAAEIKLAEIWQSVLIVNRVSRYDNFFEIGGHSLVAIQLISRINKAFDVDVPLAILFEAQTLDVLALQLENFSNDQWSALVPIQTNGEKVLFLVHPLGGEILTYRDFARAMSDEYSVYGIQSSGMMTGQDVIDDLSVMVRRYADEMETVCQSGIYYLAGRSIGGVLAIALAHEIERRGHKVEMVVLFDTFVPTKNNLEMLGLEHARAALGAFIQIDDSELVALNELEHLENLFNQAKAAYLLPQELEFSQVGNRYLVAKANIKLTQAAALEMKQSKITYPLIHIEADYSLGGSSSREGWDEYADGIDFFKITGNHENMMIPPNIDDIAQSLKQKAKALTKDFK